MAGTGDGGALTPSTITPRAPEGQEAGAWNGEHQECGKRRRRDTEGARMPGQRVSGMVGVGNAEDSGRRGTEGTRTHNHLLNHFNFSTHTPVCYR